MTRMRHATRMICGAWGLVMWAEMSDAAKWLAVGAAIVAAVIVTGQTYPLWFFLIPMIC